MEKKILFCNVAWMKDYIGVSENDKPINGGKYPETLGTGGEIYNFLDNNGKCYGFVMVGGNMALQDHYKDVKSTDEFVDDVLVVWVATNENSQTRIVGWYKNARVYKSNKETTFFTSLDHSIYYNIVANAMDCYLLPVEDRTFPIDRANVVKGGGFGQSNIWYAESEHARANIVPKVLQYIDKYEGGYSNFVYNNDFIEEDIKNIKFLDDFKKLYQEGINEFEENYYYDALIHFKAAQRIDEPIELLRKLGQSLFYLFRCDEAIEMFNRVISIEGESMDSLSFIMMSYDWKGDRENTSEYAKKVIAFPNNSKEDIEEKIFTYEVLFNIYIHEQKFEIVEKTITNLSKYLEDYSDYSKDDINNIVDSMKKILKENRMNLKG